MSGQERSKKSPLPKVFEDNNFENSIIIGKRRRGMSPRCP